MYQPKLLPVYLVLVEIGVLFVFFFEVHASTIDYSLQLGWIVAEFSDLLHFL